MFSRLFVVGCAVNKFGGATLSGWLVAPLLRIEAALSTSLWVGEAVAVLGLEKPPKSAVTPWKLCDGGVGGLGVAAASNKVGGGSTISQSITGSWYLCAGSWPWL